MCKGASVYYTFTLSFVQLLYQNKLFIITLNVDNVIFQLFELIRDYDNCIRYKIVPVQIINSTISCDIKRNIFFFCLDNYEFFYLLSYFCTTLYLSLSFRMALPVCRSDLENSLAFNIYHSVNRTRIFILKL